MNGVEVVRLYMDIVNSLISYRDNLGYEIYIESNDGLYINFSPDDFSKVLSSKLERKDMLLKLDTKNLANKDKAQKELMGCFRNLGLISTDGKKFTSTQWILGKPQKVISVDKLRWETLSKMKW